MEARSMNQQDEGRPMDDTFDPPCHIGPCDGGDDEALVQDIDLLDKDSAKAQIELMRDGEQALRDSIERNKGALAKPGWDDPEANPLEDFKKTVAEIGSVPLDAEGKIDGPFTPSEPPSFNTKDTNPKDGIGSLKPSYSCVPVPVLYELGAALTEGARKYGGYNWRVAGVRTSVYIDAARRHLDAFWEGEDIDPDSGIHHVTKAIAGLAVLRDAQINGMEQNDDRPPCFRSAWMAQAQDHANAICARHPVPVPNYTQEQMAHLDEPVLITEGRVLGYSIEVMLPAPGTEEGFVWAAQGVDPRPSLNLALAVAQALRDDGYAQRVVRVSKISERLEVMADGHSLVAGEINAVIETAFPGDPSLTEEE
jgi:hypothetical protein